MEKIIEIGLARIHAEANERRDFLPEFVALLEKNGAQVFLETGYGSGMGFTEQDYRKLAPEVIFASRDEVFSKDYVLILRCPNNADLQRLKPGACLISMLHYPTRPERTEYIRSLGVETISLDSIKDDGGRRLVENLRAVAWNGLEAAYQLLEKLYPPPGFYSPERSPIRVTQLGSGAVGLHVMQAAIRYADPKLWQKMAHRGVPGVQLLVVDYDTTTHAELMRDILRTTDILVDATQRPDPSLPVVKNEWIAGMPEYGILLDLSVDPYKCDTYPTFIKGIEGIPQGNLDQYIFAPDDPAYDHVPDCVPTQYRRHVISCYSWPGVHPKECMQVYGRQMRPLMRTLIEKGGVQHIGLAGRYFERALSRSLLSNWQPNGNGLA